MIDVYINQNGKHYTGFHMAGHANYSEKGKDIVCAAVSALAISLENAIYKLSDVPIKTSRYMNDENERIIIPAPSDKTDLLIEYFKIGIEGVEEAFPSNVRLHLVTS